MKKVISIILSLVMLFSLLPMQTFAAEQYTDTAGNWAEGAIDRWSEYGVIEGSNGRFDPNGTLTRAQMAAILSRLLALPEAKSAGFSDVKETDWYAPYINSCYAAGIMLGSDGKAQPNDPITREQAIVMLSRALGIKPIENEDLSGYTDAATVSDWAKGYVAAMAAAGIVKGTSDTTVSPKASIDRAATVTILDRAIGTYANVDGAEVIAADSGIILIAADNVKVTGAAKNATVIVSPSADGVTVNGAAVAAGTTTTAAEEKQEKPVASGGGGGGGGPTPSYSDLTIDEAKTVTGGTYNNVTITDAVGNGDVTLDGVTIKGKLIVQGGGKNSIHLDGCKVDTIQVNKDTSAQDAQQPRIELNNTPVQTIEAVKPVIIEADQKSTVKAVEAKSDVTVQGAATTVQSVSVPEDAGNVKLAVNGATVKEVEAEKPVVIEATNYAAPIEKVTAKNDVTVMGNAAQIKQVEVPTDAVKEQPVIDVQAGTVAEVKADKPAEVKGNGTVTNVEANAEVKVASETVVTITVTVQVTVTVTGDQPVEVAVETTNAVSVVTTNTKVSVSTTLNEEVNVVKKESESAEGIEVTHIHKWGSGSVTKAATCTEEGSVTYTCSGTGTCDMGNTKTETLPAKGHTADTVIPAQAATCTATGLTAGKKCSICGTVLIAQTEVAATGHKYGTATYTWTKTNDGYTCTGKRVCAHDKSHVDEATATVTSAVTKAATCTEKGETTYTATFAKEGFETQTKTEDIAVLGHKYGEATYTWAKDGNAYKCTATRICTHDASHKETETVTATYAVTTPAACETKGVGTYTATFTNEAFAEQTETEEIAALDHAYGEASYTWAEDGDDHKCTATRICTHDASHKETETVTATYAVTTPAACETNGVGTYTATFTNKAFAEQTETEEIAALGHDYTVAQHDDAQHWMKCSRCDSKTAKTDHSYDAHSCDVSAKCKDCEYVKLAGEHSYGDYTQTKAPTCTEKGSEYAFCSVCQHEDVREVEELGHSWATEFTIDTPATCTTVGSKSHHCTRCEAKTDVTEIAALNHNYGEATYTWAKTDDGYTCTGKRVCANDGTHVDEATATVTSKVTKAAACTEKGETTYTATFAKEGFEKQTETEEIAVLGHSFADAWSKDETHHWHECQREGCDAVNEKAAHSWDAGKVTKPAGVQDGEKTYTCTVCGATRKEAIHSTNTVVTDYDAFVGALNNNTVTGVTINADITVPAQDEWTKLNVAKPVVVAAGKKLTVEGYRTDGWKFGFLANDLTIVEGGSLTLEAGATLKTTAIENGEDEPFYNYTGRVCVAGGTLDISKGTVAEGSFFNYSYGDSCTDSNALTLGDNKPEIEFAVHNDAQLRAAIADPKCTGGVIVEHDITLENDLTVTKLVLINEQWTLTVPAEKKLTVADGGKLQVSGTLFVYGTLDNKGEIFNLNFIDVFGGGTLENSGKIDGSGWYDENNQFSYISSLGIEGGATLDNANTGTINDCIAVADYFGYGANKETKTCKVTGIDTIAPGNVDKMAVVFDTEQIHEQIQTLLNNNSYEIVMPCGTNATQDNTINLGSIIVPTGKTLLLKASVFDGTNTYRNTFTCTNIDVEESGAVVVQNDGSLTVTNVNVEQSGAVVVRSGGSLTVTGSLTLATSSEEYWMNDSGSIQVQSGGSLKIGDEQYTGKDGALTLGADTWLVLSGVPKDVATPEKPTGIFTILTGDAEVKSGKTFTVPAAWDNFILVDGAVLTVNGTLTNNGRMENRGTLNVYGTLNNVGTIDNQHFIDVIGGTLSNSGVIDGMKENESDERYASNIAIENGAIIYNYIGSDGGEIHDCITVADYWHTVNGPAKRCEWRAKEGDDTFTPASEDGDNPNFDVMAVGFGTEQVKAALNTVSTWGNNSAYTYESVLACGTTVWDGTDGTVYTVELGDIEVHEFGALVLKDEVFDGENTYHNKYEISSDKTLTLENGAALVGVGKDENSKVGLKIDGNIVNNGGFVDFNQFNLSGTKVVHNKTELATALEKGGTIILLPFAQGDPNRHEDKWEIGTVYESRYHVNVTAISTDTELIGLGTGNEIVAVFFDDGFTVAETKTLKIDGLNIVAVTNSTVNGTVKVYNNAQLIVQGKEGTTLTISNNGRVFVGEGEATALAIYAKGGANNKIVNDGTIKNSGKLIFDRNSQYSGSGTIEDASVVDVSSEKELMAALDNHIVSEIHIQGTWSIAGTKDNEQDDETVLRLESRNDKDLRVVIDDDAELTVPQHVRLEVSHRAELQIAEGGKLILYGGLNVFGGLKPDNWDDRDDEGQGVYVVKKEDSYVNFFPDVMEFGKRLLERVGAYGLPEMDDKEREDNREGTKDWPGDDDRIGGFEFLVKNGGVVPVTEGEGKVWRPYDKIRYGEAMKILTNVYKAIDNDATGLPTSVALGDKNWTPNDNDCISDNDVNNLLNKFVAVLPPVDAKVFAFTLERKDCSQGENPNPNCGGEGWHELVNGSHDNTVRNLHFTKAVTISNATTGLPENDTWGGKIRFEGCVFDCDVNVIYNPTCDFRVEFNESCEFKNDAKVDVEQAENPGEKDLLANRNVTVYFGCTDGKVASSARARAEAADDVSFLFNGVTVSGTNADNGGFGACMNFNCDAKHDDSFEWDANDHSGCSGGIVPEYQFTTDGDAAMSVTGTTAKNCPIRLSGIVDISGLTAQEKQEITLHNWSKCRDNNGNETEHNTDVNIGDHSVSINDSGDYVVSGTGTVTVHNQDENTCITVNGKELGSPHVFGNGGGIYLGLTDTDSVSFALEQGTWDEEAGNTSWINIEYFNAVLYNESGPVAEQNPTPTPTKLQLEKKDDNDWITNPNNVRLTVTVNGLSVVYDPLRNKDENGTEDQ